MFIDSQDVERSYDVVVAGAGPAGLVFAREYLRLSSDKARVLIIESGDTFDLQSQAQKLSRHQATGDLDSDYYPLHNQRVVGGTSSVWSGYCATLEQRSFINQEWPFDYSELAKYYPGAAKILQLPDAVHQIPEVRFPANPNLLYRPYYLSPPKRFNDSETLQWLKQAPQVDLLPNTTLLSIDEEGGAVRRLNLQSSLVNEQKQTNVTATHVSASRVVLATGGIQNARILSKLPTAKALPALGRYFCEHPHVYRQLELSFDYQQLIDVAQLEQANTVHAIALSSEFLVANKLLSATFDLSNPSMQYANLAGRRREVIVTQSTIRSEMSPIESNRINASNQYKDYLQQSIAEVHLEFDTKQIELSVRAMSDQLLRSGIGRLSLLPEQYEITGGGHMMGSTRMGLNPDSSVVNADCKVHGVEGLYLAGSSVYPATAAANPTYTIVALSLRLAKHLASESRGALI
jgi:hypothetical protein